MSNTLNIEDVKTLLGPLWRYRQNSTGSIGADLGNVIGNNRLDKSVPSISKTEQCLLIAHAGKKLKEAGYRGSIFFTITNRDTGRTVDWPNIVVQSAPTKAADLQEMKDAMAEIRREAGLDEPEVPVEAEQVEKPQGTTAASDDIPF